MSADQPSADQPSEGHPSAGHPSSTSPAYRVWPWAVALLVLGAVLVFYRLGDGPIDVYDEGLYGMHAQSALEHQQYLHAVNLRGGFPTGNVKFSKPPLSIWVTAASFEVFGSNLFGLRFPFALATFASALIAFAWGLLLERGRAGALLGFAWGVLFLASHGAYHFGRTATIDALLLAFVLLALYAHARALRSTGRRSLGFAALAGVAIALAFFTKQVVCALAVVPIAVVELVRMRREGLAKPLVRTVLALGIPFAAAVAWVALLWSRLGPATAEVLWKHAIVRRVGGFDGIHHYNYLNRIADQLDLDATPFSWQLGLFGLVLWVVERTRARDHAEDAWLLGGMFACSWLAFDAGTRSILPWYAYTLLLPLALGNALLIARAFELLRAPRELSGLDALIAASGAGALVLTATQASRTLIPAPLAGALLAALVAWCVLGVRERAAQRSRIAAAAVLALTLCGLLVRERYAYSEPEAASQLGSALRSAGARAISIDRDAQLHDYTRYTFFGVDAHNRDNPWKEPSKKAADDARVEVVVLPREAQGQPGQRIFRAAGMIAVLGAIDRDPFDREAAERKLARGPLTFEAEDFASARFDTLAYDGDASAGALRSVSDWPRRRPDSFLLAHGVLPELPAGSYRATFAVSAGCGPFTGNRLGELKLTSSANKVLASAAITCAARPRGDEELGELELRFALSKPSRVKLAVRYDQGAIDFDRVVIAHK